MRKIAVLLLTRMSLPNLGTDDDPVDGEEGAEEERDGERAQHVPVEDVHAHEVAYLEGIQTTLSLRSFTVFNLETVQWHGVHILFLTLG